MKRKLYVAVLGMSLLTACSIPKADAPEWFENAVKTKSTCDQTDADAYTYIRYK